MAKTGSRFAVFILNIVIAALSAAAVLSYFIAPLWRVKVEYLLQAETLEKMLGDEAEGVDVAEIAGDGISLRLTLEIGTTDLFAAFSDPQPKATVERMLESNVNKIVDQITPVLKEIAKRILRSEAKDNVADIVKERVKSFLSESDPAITDERVQEMLDDAGFTDEYIAEKAEELIDVVYTDGATLDSVGDKAISIVEEAFGKLADNGETQFENAELTEEDKAQIRESVSDALSSIADENGNIDIDQTVAELLLEMLRSSKDSPDGSDPDENPDEGDAPARRLLAAETGDEPPASDAGEESVQEELKAEVKQYLLDFITEETAAAIAVAMKIAAAVVVFSMLTWAYLIVKMLFKLFSKNPAVKLKLPVWLGWLPFLVLVLLPMGGIALAESLPSLLSYLGADVATKIGELLASASLSFFSAGWVAFAAAVALVVISVPYGMLRRSLKRKNRDEEDD